MARKNVKRRPWDYYQQKSGALRRVRDNDSQYRAPSGWWVWSSTSVFDVRNGCIPITYAEARRIMKGVS